VAPLHPYIANADAVGIPHRQSFFDRESEIASDVNEWDENHQ
jgi:hypothetical protein